MRDFVHKGENGWSVKTVRAGTTRKTGTAWGCAAILLENQIAHWTWFALIKCGGAVTRDWGSSSSKFHKDCQIVQETESS